MSNLEYLWNMDSLMLDKEYKTLCKQYHPDRNPDSICIFEDLVETYEKIKKYRETNLEIVLSVSLSEIYHGCVKDIRIVNPITDLDEYLPVFIPSGIMNQEKLIIKTQYHKPLHVKINEVNDTKFIRDGYNLIVNIDLTLSQALQNDVVIMGHFNKTINIPTKIPHSNYRHVIHSMGMPIPRIHEKYGDLYILYNVIFPKDSNYLG